MSLERYRRPRLVVLRPSASAYEAARAMADNHVGVILVGQDQHLVGVVTDRDLALDVIAGDLDAHATTVHEVMSDEVATVDVGAAVGDVVRIMRERACRRVPLVEQGRPVGLVTLDDLLLEGDIDQEVASAIIAAQLEGGARFKAEGVPHPIEPARPGMGDGGRRARRRAEARAEGTYGRLLHEVERHTGLAGRGKAEMALQTVVGAIMRRLSPDEALQFIAQLPSRLHAVLSRHAEGPDRGVTTALIEADLADRLGLDLDRASEVLSGVLEVVSASVSAGEIDDVRAQLPTAMKDLFPPAPIRKAG